MIPRGAKHPDEAWEFIRYATSANVNARSKGELTGAELLCFQQGKSSALVQWSPFFEQHHPHPFIDVFRKLGASETTATMPRIAIWKEYQEELNEVFSEVRLLRATPEAAVLRGQARARRASPNKSRASRAAVFG